MIEDIDMHLAIMVGIELSEATKAVIHYAVYHIILYKIFKA